MAIDGYFYKNLQAQIIRGSTRFYSNTLKSEVFIKHLDNFISSDVDLQYHEFLDKAKSKGLRTAEESLQHILKEKLWTKEEDEKIKTQKEFLERLNITKKKNFLKAEKQRLEIQISQVEKEIKELQSKKDDLIGLTAEIYAGRKVNTLFIYLSLFKDQKTTEHFFTKEEFDDLEDEALRELVSSFNKYSDNFNSKNLKRVALQPSFLNYFYLCENNPFIFYGKPVCDLTYYQAEVFSHAKYYKQVLSEMKGPVLQEFTEDPDKMIEWFEDNKNVEKLLQKVSEKDDMNVSIVGATKEDLDNLGLSSSGKAINLAQRAAQKGGSLNMREMLEAQGL